MSAASLSNAMEPSEDFLEISGENVQIVYCEVFQGPEKPAAKVCALRKGSR